MATAHHGNLAIAERYITAVERGAAGDELAGYFTPDVVQEEFPNRLVPNGARRDLAAILEAAVRGQQVTSAQRYEIVHAVAGGNDVALEVQWSATLAVAVGRIPAGGQMRARFAVFLEFRDGKIARQRNYDCFEPF
jgi:ketosteroid isomerase-like protein